MKNLTLVAVLLCLSISLKAFHAVLNISVSPSDSKIYVDNVLKGMGKVSITLSEAKEIQVRIEKEGYITISDYYAYGVSKNSGSRKSYERGENNIVIELVKGGVTDKTNSNSKKELVSKEQSSEKPSALLNEKAGMAKVIIIDGKYVFTNCEPILPYETVFECSCKVTAAGGFACPNIMEFAEGIVKCAIKKGFPFDAIILGTGKNDFAIRFK